MQAFMQSLQMRWPVAAHIGLSMITIPQRADAVPAGSDQVHLGDFLVSGQPASVTPNGSSCIRRSSP